MIYGLKKSIIESICNVFELFPEIDEVIVYGSRAKGNYKNGSDIDITLLGEFIDLSLVSKIELNLDNLFLPYQFDISIFNQISNTELREHINRVGKSFYKKNNLKL